MNYKGYKLTVTREPKSSKHYVDATGLVRSKLKDVVHCSIAHNGKPLGYELTIANAKLRVDEIVRLKSNG